MGRFLNTWLNEIVLCCFWQLRSKRFVRVRRGAVHANAGLTNNANSRRQCVLDSHANLSPAIKWTATILLQEISPNPSPASVCWRRLFWGEYFSTSWTRQNIGEIIKNKKCSEDRRIVLDFNSTVLIGRSKILTFESIGTLVHREGQRTSLQYTRNIWDVNFSRNLRIFKKTQTKWKPLNSMKFTKRAMVHSKETRESQKEFWDEYDELEISETQAACINYFRKSKSWSSRSGNWNSSFHLSICTRHVFAFDFVSFWSVHLNFRVPERYAYLSGPGSWNWSKPKVQGTPTVGSISTQRGLYRGDSLVPIHHLPVPGGKCWMGTTETF